MTTPKKKLTPPPPPKQSTPPPPPPTTAVKEPLKVRVRVAGGKEYALAILEGENVIKDLDHREAKDFGLTVVDAVRAALAAEE